MKKTIILLIVLTLFAFSATVSAYAHQASLDNTGYQLLSAPPQGDPPPPPPPEKKKHHKHKNPPQPDNPPPPGP